MCKPMFGIFVLLAFCSLQVLSAFVPQNQENDSDTLISQLLKQQNELLTVVAQQQQQQKMLFDIMLQEIWKKVPSPSSALTGIDNVYGRYGPNMEAIEKLSSNSVGNLFSPLDYYQNMGAATTKRQTRGYDTDNKFTIF